MSYRWIEHTAELELEIEASSPEAVFADALTAFADLLADEEAVLTDKKPGEPGGAVSVQLSLAGPDRAGLLAEWLDELVFRAETEGLVPIAVERLELGVRDLRATVRGARGHPRHLVKGVTHHRLAFEPAEGGFRATLVLDV